MYVLRVELDHLEEVEKRYLDEEYLKSVDMRLDVSLPVVLTLQVKNYSKLLRVDGCIEEKLESLAIDVLDRVKGAYFAYICFDSIYVYCDLSGDSWCGASVMDISSNVSAFASVCWYKRLMEVNVDTFVTVKVVNVLSDDIEDFMVRRQNLLRYSYVYAEARKYFKKRFINKLSVTDLERKLLEDKEFDVTKMRKRDVEGVFVRKEWYDRKYRWVVSTEGVDSNKIREKIKEIVML